MVNKKPSIMIVDDSPGNIKMLEEALKNEYHIETASTPSIAIDLLKSNRKPDIVLLDIIMPEMDGYALCRIIKNDPDTKNIPVIFLTARDTTDDEVEGLSMGAVDYISKPYNMPIIKARINTHIDLKRKYELLESMAMIDGLTEIPNRRYLEEHIEKEWRRNLRVRKHLSCIMMDIDFFKLYNDNYGHLQGDLCLKKVSSAISNSLCRPGDFVARYGGEEFAAILPETDLNYAFDIAVNIQDAVRSLDIRHDYSSALDRVSLSIGVASIVPEIGMTHEYLINQADDNLYKAKKNGRNQIVK